MTVFGVRAAFLRDLEGDVPEGQDGESDRARMQRATEAGIARRWARARDEVEHGSDGAGDDRQADAEPE